MRGYGRQVVNPGSLLLALDTEEAPTFPMLSIRCIDFPANMICVYVMMYVRVHVYV